MRSIRHPLGGISCAHWALFDIWTERVGILIELAVPTKAAPQSGDGKQSKQMQVQARSEVHPELEAWRR